VRETKDMPEFVDEYAHESLRLLKQRPVKHDVSVDDAAPRLAQQLGDALLSRVQTYAAGALLPLPATMSSRHPKRYLMMSVLGGGGKRAHHNS
jgi:hypothetical protein